jgi:hypothetical protein
MVLAVMFGLATLGIAGTDSTNCHRVFAGSEFAPPTQIWLQAIPEATIAKEVIDTIFETAAAIWAPYNVIVNPVFTLSRPDAQGCRWIKMVLRNRPANRIDGKAPAGYRALASLPFIGATPGDVMYASFDIALATVAAAGLDRAPAPIQGRWAAQFLGKAIAHELGHYLLRSRQHVKEGLMRASFESADLLSQDPARFRLMPRQAALLSKSSFACVLADTGSSLPARLPEY